jgi:glutathione S-transferase
VSEARDRLRAAYDMVEKDMATRTWAVGERYSMADCAASPALFYANLVIPLDEAHPHTAAYLLRLMQRPSFARVLHEAQPYMHMVPREPAQA